MLVPVKGSKYPNKINWSNVVKKLNEYNLTNAQKNLIRRVNIAIAAQPTKGSTERRLAVRIPLSDNRNTNIAAQVRAVKQSKNASRQYNNTETRPKRVSVTTPGPFRPTIPYGIT